MSDTAWAPLHTYDLLEVLEHGRLDTLGPGAPRERIEASLGTPQHRPAPIDRRATLWSHVYGNVSLTTTRTQVIEIELDFEGRRPRMVEPGALAQWSLAQWQDFARARGLVARTLAGVLRLESEALNVALDAETGELHIVTLRAPASPQPR